MDLVVSLRSVFGSCLGIPKLSISVQVKSTTEPILKVLNVHAEVRAGNTLQVYDMSKSVYFLGFAFLESNGGQFTRGSESYWDLALPLTPYHLQKVEEVRKGEDLYLFLRFHVTAAEMENPSNPQLRRFTSPTVRGDTSSDYVPFKVAQSDWVRILKDLGYGEYLLIEVPLRAVPARRKMEKALGHLTAAWEHFSEGRDDETLACCYKAFEYIAKQKGMKGPDQNAFEKLLANVEDPEKRRSLKLLVDYVCRFLNLGRHEPGRDRIMLDRRDSEYALILSQASLAYLAKVMAE